VLERRFEDLTHIIKYFVQRDVVYVGIVNKMWDIKHHIVCIGRTETSKDKCSSFKNRS